MIAYLDTSALVKRYVHEEGTDDVLALWAEAEHVAISRLGFAEAVAAFRRKQREEGSSAELLDTVLTRFEQEWPTFLIVELSPELQPAIRRILDEHPLKGADSVHLASALGLREAIQEPVLFACWDGALLQAARREGLTTVP